MQVEHLAADVAVLATQARLVETQVRFLREGDLERQAEHVVGLLLELRQRADRLVEKWGDRL